MLRKQTIDKIEQYYKWHMWIFQKLKNYPKTAQNPKLKQFIKSYKESSNEEKQTIVKI